MESGYTQLIMLINLIQIDHTQCSTIKMDNKLLDFFPKSKNYPNSKPSANFVNILSFLIKNILRSDFKWFD